MNMLTVRTRISLTLFIIIVWVAGCCDAPRPEDTTDPGVFAGDGAEFDYCVITELDGDGLTGRNWKGRMEGRMGSNLYLDKSLFQ